MKICYTCKVDKDETEFNKRGNHLQSYCRQCARLKHKKFYQDNKAHCIEYSLNAKWQIRANALQFVMDYCKDGCSECNEKDFTCLEFDHIDPTTKRMNISIMVGRGYSINSIKAELVKCRILCANCHKKRTAKQFGWYKSLIPYFTKNKYFE